MGCGSQHAANSMQMGAKCCKWEPNAANNKAITTAANSAPSGGLERKGGDIHHPHTHTEIYIYIYIIYTHYARTYDILYPMAFGSSKLPPRSGKMQYQFSLDS